MAFGYSYRLLLKLLFFMFLLFGLVVGWDGIFVMSGLCLVVSFVVWGLMRLNRKVVGDAYMFSRVEIKDDGVVTAVALPMGKVYRVFSFLVKRGDGYLAIRFPFSLVYFYSYFPLEEVGRRVKFFGGGYLKGFTCGSLG